ncbi:uncharacterized protein [Diadema antillarum]|uniref:uncharacterized protein n=1 Tax=Diadema antillarum TaxID=105358 RepID=UPI003A842E88
MHQGGLAADQIRNVRWFQGPSFLWETNLEVEDITCDLKVGDPEVKAINLTAMSIPEPPVNRASVRHFPQKVQHQGRGITQNEVRSNSYWIVNGSKVVIDLERNCVPCRRLRRPGEEQKMANLPEDRTETDTPLSLTLAWIALAHSLSREGVQKSTVWLDFHVLLYQGFHIEMLDDMSTDSFINALRCFIAIRGAVRQISDQGTNFVGARNEFQAGLNELDNKKIKMYLADRQCDFLFSVPQSSHAGRVWERQIRTIRSILRATIDMCSGRVTDSALLTFLYESRAIVNNRPVRRST